MTASGESKNHTIQDLIRSRDEAIQARDREIRHLGEQLQQVTSEMNQSDQTIRQTCEPSIDLGNEMQRISISTRQECAHQPEIRLSWRMSKLAPEVSNNRHSNYSGLKSSLPCQRKDTQQRQYAFKQRLS